MPSFLFLLHFLLGFNVTFSWILTMYFDYFLQLSLSSGFPFQNSHCYFHVNFFVRCSSWIPEKICNACLSDPVLLYLTWWSTVSCDHPVCVCVCVCVFVYVCVSVFACLCASVCLSHFVYWVILGGYHQYPWWFHNMTILRRAVINMGVTHCYFVLTCIPLIMCQRVVQQDHMVVLR
jgi:hypothetical protein